MTKAETVLMKCKTLSGTHSIFMAKLGLSTSREAERRRENIFQYKTSFVEKKNAKAWEDFLCKFSYVL